MLRFGGWPPPLLTGRIEEVAGEADFSDYGKRMHEDVARGLNASDEWLRRFRVREASQVIGMTLAASTFHNNALDLYFPYAYYRDVLKVAARDAAVGAALGEVRTPELDLRVLGKLLQADLPTVDDLAPQDIVAMRANEEAFALWRDALRRGVERVTAAGTDVMDADSSMLEAIRGELRHDEKELRARVGTGALRGQARQTGRRFLIGALAAGATSMWWDPVKSLATSATVSTLDLLLSYIQTRNRTPQQALSRHFALFAPPVRRSAP